MDPRVIRIAERCQLYQKQRLLHTIQYGGVNWAGTGDQWQSFDAWEQCQNLLHRDLEKLGITPEEEWWVAWELGLQDWWGDSEEFWGRDPRVGTEWEIPRGTLH